MIRSLPLCLLLALGGLAQAQDGLPIDVQVVHGEITGTSVNLRDGPGEGHAIVLRFGGGNQVRILGRAPDDQGRDREWARVSLPGSGGPTTGWVAAAYVKETGRSVGGSVPAGAVDLAAEIKNDLAFVRSDRFTPDNAAGLMNERFHELDQLTPEDFDFRTIDQDPDRLIKDLFALVLALDDRMADFEAQGQLTDAIVDAKRRAMRALRFLREEVILRTQATAPGRLYEHGKPALASQDFTSAYHWVVNPAYDLPMTPAAYPRTFFIMNVGNTTVSATIARATSVDTMFSHFTVGYVSDREQTIEGTTYPAGTMFTMEAHIELGVVIRPVKEHFKSSVREVVFFVRDRDQQAAVDRAADEMFEKVKQAQNDGNPLGYDFSMGHKYIKGFQQALGGGQSGTAAGKPKAPKKRNLMQLNNFFCSGVADAIGDEAGLNIFPHRSYLDQGPNTRDLYVSWGMDPSRRVPAPGDGDVSTSLVRVAEGSRIDELEDSHIMHAVLVSMFDWLDHDGYKLRQPAWFKVASFVAGHLNAETWNIGFIPRGINTPIMRSFASVHKAASALFKRLKAENDAFKAEHQRSMTPEELEARLRQVRDQVDDAKTWFRP